MNPSTPPSPPRPPRRRLRRWAVGLGVSYLAAVVGLCAWAFAGGDADEWPTLVLFAPRWPVLLPAVVLAPLALFARSWWAGAAVAAAVAVGVGPAMGGRVNPGAWGDPPPVFSVVRVLTWNAAGGRPNEAFLGFVKLRPPDVILTVESSADPLLPDALRGWHTADGGSGIRLHSRFPVRLVGSLGANELGMPGGAADFAVTTPDGPVRVVGVHLPTPREGVEAVLHNRFADLSELRRVIAGRDAASAKVRRWVGDTTRPTLLAGDFNTTVESRVYRRDWDTFANAYSAAGTGWGGTKQTRWHAARIDHILSSPAFRVRKAEVGPDSGSDHRPVFAEFELLVSE